MPKVSVIIPCYNLGAYLDEAVSSVLAQTFTDFEILVVNDGSTDIFTCNLLENYKRPKTRVLHTENLGVSAARNLGIREASGEYILPLDADDIIAQNYLETAVDILSNNSEVGIVYGKAEYFGERAGIVNLPPYSQSTILWRNSIFSAAFFRKSDWGKVGGYRVSMRHGWEDWDFWLSLVSLSVKVIYVPDIVLYYRVRKGSRDSSLKFSKKIELIYKMIFNHSGLYFKNGVKGLVAILSDKLFLNFKNIN